MGTRFARRIGSVFLAVGMAGVSVACGGGEDGDNPEAASSPSASHSVAATEPSAAPSTSPSAVTGSAELRAQFDAALAPVNQAIDAFNATIHKDLRAGDLTAVKADAAALRNAFFNFDAALREISFPPETQELVNKVLTTIGQYIAVLDEFQTAQTPDEANQLLSRGEEAQAEIITAVDELYNAVAQG